MSPLISCLTIAVKLTATIEKRLDRLAKRTGRVKSYYVREALLNRFDDLEDFYSAEKRLKEGSCVEARKEARNECRNSR